NRRRLDFDPRELHILLYDVDCLAAEAAECSHLEAIALRQNVLRVRVLRGRREDALALLSQPTTPPVRVARHRLVAQLPGAGWKALPADRARELARQFEKQTLDAEFYEHGDGEVVYGRMLAPFQLIKTSESEAVCIAAATDVFMPEV